MGQLVYSRRTIVEKGAAVGEAYKALICSPRDRVIKPFDIQIGLAVVGYTRSRFIPILSRGNRVLFPFNLRRVKWQPFLKRHAHALQLGLSQIELVVQRKMDPETSCGTF